jgi:pyrrolidone-carboxylate peptidase
MEYRKIVEQSAFPDHDQSVKIFTRSRWLTPALVAMSLLATPGIATAAPQKTDCYDTTAPLTVEEQRLDDTLAPGGPAVGPELVHLAGFDDQVTRFTARLCGTFGLRQAQQLADSSGSALWRAAVTRAQSAQGSWDAYDDRPLYWARLHLTKALHQWQPKGWQLGAADRVRLIDTLDRASRGVPDVDFPQRKGIRRILVTGFDPFQLNGPNVRRSNPAGVAALQLDGKVFDTPQGAVVVQAAVLPVLWGAFDQGVVEAVYGDALRAETRPDAFVTISQGRPGLFDIERWAGRWRGGAPDNNDLGSRGTVPNAAGWPQPADEFIETTLPYEKMINAGTGPFTVNFNRRFCEWPLGTTPGTGTPSCRTDEPTPGAVAAQGGGGDYLSNESMYRANRVRLGMGATGVFGGHLHTPVLGQPVDPSALTDTAFETERRNIADQAVSLVAVV